MGGHRLLRPSTTPEPSTTSFTGRWGKPSHIGTLERQPGAAWHRPPVSRTGGRRVTTDAPGGGTASKRQTDREEARGGERDARAGKLAEEKELGAGESRRGERGRDQGHQWKGKRST